MLDEVGGAEQIAFSPMPASSSAFGSTRSSELALSIGQEVGVGSVVVVVTIALGLLLSSGAAAS